MVKETLLRFQKRRSIYWPVEKHLVFQGRLSNTVTIIITKITNANYTLCSGGNKTGPAKVWRFLTMVRDVNFLLFYPSSKCHWNHNISEVGSTSVFRRQGRQKPDLLGPVVELVSDWSRTNSKPHKKKLNFRQSSVSQQTYRLFMESKSSIPCSQQTSSEHYSLQYLWIFTEDVCRSLV